MSRSRSRSLSRKRTSSPAIDRRYSYERSVSRERSTRRREKRLSKERERIRYRSPSATRSRSPRITRLSRRHSRSKSRNGRRRSSSHESPQVCPGDLRRQKYENPAKSRCLGIFGLSEHTTQHQIEKIFSEFGPIEQVRVVIDAKSGRSRGYCFVYFEQIEDAATAKESCANLVVDSRRVRVDYSITQRAHTPTPGIYKGVHLYRQQQQQQQLQRYGRDGRDGGSGGSNGGFGQRSFNRNPRPVRYARGHRRSRSYSPRDRRYR